MSYKKEFSLHHWISQPLTEGPLREAIEMPPIEYTHSVNADASISYFFKFAMENRANGQFLPAIAAYKKLLALDPSHFKARVNLGVCLLKMKSKRAALEQLDRAIEINPLHHAGYFNKALAFIYVSNYEDAIRVLNQGFQTIEEIPDSFRKLRAYCLIRNGKVSTALETEFKTDPLELSLSTAMIPESVREIKTSSPMKTQLSTIKPMHRIRRMSIRHKKRGRKRSMTTRNYREISECKDIAVNDYHKSKIDSDNGWFTKSEIKWIKQEVANAFKNTNKLDKILSKLPVFKSFNFYERKFIMENMGIHKYLTDAILQSESTLYVILKGSVERKNRKSYLMEKLFEGDYFEGREGYKTSEKSCLLEIPINEFIARNMNSDKKIEFFENLPFFKGIEAGLLWQLAKNISYRQYKPNEYVLKKGNMPEGLYIIYSGTACILYENADRKTNKLFSDKTRCLGKILDIQGQEFSRLKHNSSDKNNVLLHSGDYFEGRALLDGDLFKEIKQDHSIRFRTVKLIPSKFSVMAQSADLTVCVITKESLHSMNYKIFAALKDYLQKEYEIECLRSSSISQYRNSLKIKTRQSSVERSKPLPIIKFNH